VVFFLYIFYRRYVAIPPQTRKSRFFSPEIAAKHAGDTWYSAKIPYLRCSCAIFKHILPAPHGVLPSPYGIFPVRKLVKWSVYYL
jgi:hypothetical protein